MDITNYKFMNVADSTEMNKIGQISRKINEGTIPGVVIADYGQPIAAIVSIQDFNFLLAAKEAAARKSANPEQPMQDLGMRVGGAAFVPKG